MKLSNLRWFSVLLCLFFVSCARQSAFVPKLNTYRVEGSRLIKDNKPFLVKGVVYVPAYPGFLPWELKNETDIPKKLVKRMRADIRDMKKMGANTIRLWDAPPKFYEILSEFDDLNFIQTIWFDVAQKDFQDIVFKESCREEIRKILDKIYAAYEEKGEPPVLAYLVGNELSEESIRATDAAHPDVTSYDGKYFHADEGSSATECFLAEMGDFLQRYEREKFGKRHLVSYANEIRTEEILDTPFLSFRSYNVYPNAINEYTLLRENEGRSAYEQWIAELKAKHPEFPLLITETGLSVSPAAAHAGPPHYGYGGNTEEEQADFIKDVWKGVQKGKLPVVGAVIHEYLDAWWKFDKADSFSQDPEDVEEWFGLVSIVEDGDFYKTKPRPAYHALQKAWKK